MGLVGVMSAEARETFHSGPSAEARRLRDKINRHAAARIIGDMIR
jgi:hypothetical protein